MKTCNKCGIEKPKSEFNKAPGNTDGRNNRCKACIKIIAHNRYIKNPCREERRVANLRYKYGLTPHQFNEMLEAQNFKCVICSDELVIGKGKHAIDHNHDTGEVRGILCQSCNFGIGFLKDNPQVLRSALEYLETKGHYGKQT